MTKPLADIERVLAYPFDDSDLLLQALTHRSFSKTHNEVLEFVGDAALGLVIAHDLRARFPNASEGELSRLRSILVRGDTLAEIAIEHDIGDWIAMGDGELASGGRQRHSILADAVEAIIGAVFTDGGYDAAETLIMGWYAPRLNKVTLADSKDAKTQLQEHLQSKRLPLPTYRVEKTEGQQHQQSFYVVCQADKKQSQGRGTTRRKAEQDAASHMLTKLGLR